MRLAELDVTLHVFATLRLPHSIHADRRCCARGHCCGLRIALCRRRSRSARHGPRDPRRLRRRRPAPRARSRGATAPTYTVKRGDTLYKIALDNGLDYRELAAWNAIENINVIREGQSLRLTAPGEPAPRRPA